MDAFSHLNSEVFKRGTIMVTLPKKSDMQDFFNAHGTCLLLPVGVARLGSKHQFIKKEGRKYSKENSMFTKCDLSRVDIRDTKHLYHFEAKVPNRCPGEPKSQTISFGISTIKESENCQLVYAYFLERDDQ